MENESAMPPFFPQPSVFSGSAIETFITTRYGGVSSSPYSFFSCSPFVSDPASGQNRALLAGHLHAAEADFLAFQASDTKNRELVALVTHDILNILKLPLQRVDLRLYFGGLFLQRFRRNFQCDFHRPSPLIS